MERLSALSTGTKVLLGAAILLLIVTFLPWQSYDGPGSELADELGVDFSVNAWHGFWGVMLGLLTIALIAWVGLRIANVDLKSVNLPASEPLITAALAALIFLFALLKNLTDDFSTFWSYIGVVLAAGVAIGAWLRMQETGTPMPSRASASTDTSPSPASTTTAPPAAPSQAPPPSSTPPPPPAESA